MAPEVLIVGDASRRRLLLEQIAQLGYATECVAPRDAERRLEDDPSPRVVIVATDDADPATLMARLRRSRRGASVPVILYGRFGGESRELVDVLDLGADHFLEEPAGVDDLADALKELAGPAAEEISARLTAADRRGDRPAGATQLDHRDRTETDPTAPPPRPASSVLGQLHRTLDMLQARLHGDDEPTAPGEARGDDIDLATMGLGAVPEVDEGGELLDPAESHSRMTVGGQSRPARPDDVTALPLAEGRVPAHGRPESTVRLGQEESGLGHAMPAPVTGPGTAPIAKRRRALTSLPVAERGTIEEIEVPRLLWKLNRTAMTGRLSLVRGRVEKQLWLDDGEVVFARSNLSQDRLVDGLLRRGALTRSQYEAARRLAAKEPRRAGQLLVEAGFIKPRELHGALRTHLVRIVESTFSWEEGTWSLQRDIECEEPVLLDTPTAAVIIEGIRNCMEAPQLRRLLGRGDQFPRLTRRATAMPGGIRGLADELRLTETEEALLPLLDGKHVLDQIVSQSDGGEPGTLALIYGLSVLELCELLGEPEPAAAPEHDPEQLDRNRVRERLRLARQADYFELLGVPHDASRVEVLRAYEDLRETFSDENLEPTSREALASELRELRTALLEARDILGDEAMRGAYLAHLGEP